MDDRPAMNTSPDAAEYVGTLERGIAQLRAELSDEKAINEGHTEAVRDLRSALKHANTSGLSVTHRVLKKENERLQEDNARLRDMASNRKSEVEQLRAEVTRLSTTKRGSERILELEREAERLQERDKANDEDLDAEREEKERLQDDVQKLQVALGKEQKQAERLQEALDQPHRGGVCQT